jgi:hypothetical protein
MRTRLIPLCLLVVIVTSSAMAATAWGHEYFVEGAKIEGAVEKSFEGGLWYNVSKIESTLGAAKVSIECYSSDITGKLKAEGESEGEIKLARCYVFEITAANRRPNLLEGCKVKVVNNVLESTGKLINGAAGFGAEDEVVGKKAGEEFGKVKVEGATCGVTGESALKGKEFCTMPDGEVELPFHFEGCLPPGSKMKLGAESAKLWYAPLISVEVNKKWSLK